MIISYGCSHSITYTLNRINGITYGIVFAYLTYLKEEAAYFEGMKRLQIVIEPICGPCEDITIGRNASVAFSSRRYRTWQ